MHINDTCTIESGHSQLSFGVLIIKNRFSGNEDIDRLSSSSLFDVACHFFKMPCLNAMYSNDSHVITQANSINVISVVCEPILINNTSNES